MSSHLKYKIYSKKGIAIADYLPIFVVIFIITIGIFFFRINEKVRNERQLEEIQNQKDIIDGHAILIEYLIKEDEQGINKADLIFKAHIEKNYETIKEDMDAYFSNKLSHLPSWYLGLYDSSQNLIFAVQKSGSYTGLEQLEATREVAIEITPVNNGKPDYITLRLFFS